MTITIQDHQLTIQGKKWDELSPQGKTRVILSATLQVISGIVQLALLISALADIRRRPPEQIRGKKWAWVLISFINYIGPIAYFLFGRVK
jgi:hypothetical protein